MFVSEWVFFIAQDHKVLSTDSYALTEVNYLLGDYNQLYTTITVLLLVIASNW